MKEETKKKISDSKRGVSVKHSGQFKAGAVSWNKGKKTSEETKSKQRLAKLKNPIKYWLGKKRPDLDLSNRVLSKGKNHWNWKGGINPINDTIRKSSEYKFWRKEVFKRDNFTCQVSGQSGGDLIVHHINNFADFPELRTNIENGITMTKKIHKEFHKKYGVKNNTQEQLEKFIYNTVTSKFGCVASVSET